MSANAEAVLATESLKVRWYGATAFKDWIVSPVGEGRCVGSFA